MPRRSPPQTMLLRAHAILAHEVAAGLAEVVLRQARDKIGGDAEVGQRHGDVGFAAGIGHVPRARLHEALEARRAQAHHDLAKGDDFVSSHLFLLDYYGYVLGTVAIRAPRPVMLSPATRLAPQTASG